MYPIEARPPIYQSASHVKTTFVVIGTLLVGTGSTYSMDRAEEWRNHIQFRAPLIVDKSPVSIDSRSKPDVRSVAEHIENIRLVLNPSVTDLANLFDISRQAVYKWLSGESIPDQEKQSRIIKLSQIADSFNAAKISRTDSLLKIKTFNGLSLMELLKTGDDCSTHVADLIAEAKAMDASYKRSGLAISKAKPTSDWLSYASIPGSSEQEI